MKKFQNKSATDVTTNDIMDFLVQHMATKDELRHEIGALRSEIKDDMGKLRSDIIDYIGKEISDLKVDLSTLIRQNDRKITVLLDILKANNIITAAQAKKVHSLTAA